MREGAAAAGGLLGAALQLLLQVALRGLAALLVRGHGLRTPRTGGGIGGSAGRRRRGPERPRPAGRGPSLGGGAVRPPGAPGRRSVPRNLHGCSSAPFPPARSARTATPWLRGRGRSASSSIPAWTPSSRWPEMLAEDGLKPVAVVLTHGHLDHTFSVLPVCDGYDIPAYLHPDDFGMLSRPRPLARPGAGPADHRRPAARPVGRPAAGRRRGAVAGRGRADRPARARATRRAR